MTKLIVPPPCKHRRKRYKLVGLNLKWTCLNCTYFEIVPTTTKPGRWEDSPTKDAEGE
jgi:hypothetical protein